MRTFDEIEEEEARLTVQMVGKPSGSGFLILNRGQTLLTLTTPSIFHPDTDVNGWFDVNLRRGRQSILLRNALMRGQTDHGTRNEVWETQVFPNFVVFNSDALDKSGKVRNALFRFDKFDDFFNHHVVEHQNLYDAPKDVLHSLKRLRKNKYSKMYPVRYDFHKPRSVYLVHLPPRILAFDALGHHFEIHWGMRSRGLGWDGIDVRAEPFATIQFSEPKTIDEAIDEIWVWKRLFCQLAMERLDLTMISARGGSKRIYADVYLSNTKKREGKREFDPWGFRSGETPFSTWKERRRLSSAMKAWLSKETARHVFRVNVDRVIANMRKGESLEDVVTLCSAVESLDELKSSQTLNDKDLKRLSKAAIQGAQEAGVTIDPARIRSVLALLKHQSLPQRLKLLMQAISPHVSPEQAKIIISGALSLRTIAAHGGSLATLTIPRVSPIVSALAGACVLFDLLTSDFPPTANEHRRLRASRQIGEAMNWMLHLQAQAKTAAT